MVRYALIITMAALVSAAVGCGAGGERPAPLAPGARLVRVGTFSSPTYVAAPRGDRHRLFVVERAGRIRVLVDGKRRARPFLNIAGSVRTGGERGLLSMAFARDYARSGRFFVYFNDRRGDIHIQQFRRSRANPGVAARGSRRNLLTIRHRDFSNHNGGQLQVGPDGDLYAGVGDGGGAGDPHRHGQSLRTYLGKLLRIDPGAHGGVPRTNPFRGRRGARPLIWAFGLRNPWRFSFDRRTGALAIGDVGQDRYEEVDYAPRRGRGANYGWNAFEGRHRYSRAHVRGHAVRPVLERLRAVVLRRGSARGDRAVGVGVGGLVSFGEDGAGRVYAVSLRGAVYRLAAP